MKKYKSKKSIYKINYIYFKIIKLLKTYTTKII